MAASVADGEATANTLTEDIHAQHTTTQDVQEDIVEDTNNVTTDAEVDTDEEEYSSIPPQVQSLSCDEFDSDSSYYAED
jgi:hypothetical protein